MSGLRNNRFWLHSIGVPVLLSCLASSGLGALAGDRPPTSDDIPALLRQLDWGQADVSHEAAQKLASLGPNSLAGIKPQLDQLSRFSIYAHTRVMAAELAEGRTPAMKPDAIRLAVEMLRQRPDDPLAALRAAMLREVEPGGQQMDMQPPAASIAAANPASAPVIPPPPQPPDWERDIPKWAEQLSSRQDDVRMLAAQSLALSASHDPKGKAIGPLCLALDSADNSFRIEVAEALRTYGPAAARAAPALSRMADNADPGVRIAAVRALLRIDAPAGALISALIASILQNDESCSDAVAANIRPDATPNLLPKLMEMARSDPDRRVRALASAAEDSVERTASTRGH